MKYRKLGQTEIVISVVGIGAWQLGGEWGKSFEPKEVKAIFEAARRVGINLVDTAECYGDHTSEALIGQAIAQDRNSWIVATKFGHKFHGIKDRSTDFSVQGMLSQLEDSLRALRTDWIDIYQFHGVSEETFRNDELWSELDRQKRLGKIRAIGVSIGGDAMPLGRDTVQTVQVLYNRLNRVAEEELLPLCQERQFGVLARGPLASGCLSGKYKPGQKWPEGDVRHGRDYDTPLRQAQHIREQEVPEAVPMAAWVLSWCLRNPAVTAVIPGCKSVQQLRSNAAAAELDISQEDHPQAVGVPEKYT